MILSFLRRFGAALVFCLAPLSIAAAAEPDSAVAQPAGDAAASRPAGGEKPNPNAAPAANVAAVPNTAAAPADASPPPMSILKAKEEAEREGRRLGARSTAPDGTLLVWDKVNSVWVSTTGKHTYWVVDRYYRFNEGVWLMSKQIAGPWELTPLRLVPEAPRGRHKVPKTAVTVTLPSGLEAVYEPGIKAFKIAGRKGVFLFDAAFYRYDGGVWLDSKTADGPWAPTSAIVLPQLLRRAVPPPEQGSRVTLPGGEAVVSTGESNLFDVDGKPDVLFFDGSFYERRDDKWFQSASASSGWEAVSTPKVPGPVRATYLKGADAKAGKGAAKAKDSSKKKPAKD